VTMDAAKTVTATFGSQVTPPPPKPTPVKCVVPNVRLKTLAAAKRKITAGHCKLGKVTKAKSTTVPKVKGDLAEPAGREEAHARRQGQPRSQSRQALKPLPEAQERPLGPRT
jgi:hypothetical protein